MKSLSDWVLESVCINDETPSSWLSYNIKDIKYAKDGCSRCEVRIPCFLRAWGEDSYAGVNAGISEYDILMLTWKETSKENGKNWARSNKLLQKILQRIK